MVARQDAGLTTLSDAAAENLSRYKGALYLDSLTELPDAAAESLSTHEAELELELSNLSSSAAKILRKHPSFQNE